MLINPAVVIILRYLNVLNHPYTLNLHNVICQSYLDTLEDTEKFRKKREKIHRKIFGGDRPVPYFEVMEATQPFTFAKKHRTVH